MLLNSIAVHCSAQNGYDAADIAAAILFGRLLAKKKKRLVYGGSNSGLMIALADSVLDNGGSVLGVFPSDAFPNPHEWEWKERRNPRLDNSNDRRRIILVNSMPERKQVMSNESQAACALPGGLGTLDEMYEHVTGTYLKLHNNGLWKPYGLLNTIGRNDSRGFYDLDIESLDYKVTRGSITPRDRALIVDDHEPAGLLRKLELLVQNGPVLV